MTSSAFAAGGFVLGVTVGPSNSASAGAPGMIPLDGVSVMIQGTKHSAITTATGQFMFSDVRPGRYKIVASKQGYGPSVQDIEVKSGQPVQVSLTLLPGTTPNFGSHIIPGGVVYVAFASFQAARPVVTSPQPGGMNNPYAGSMGGASAYGPGLMMPQGAGMDGTTPPLTGYTYLQAIGAGADPFALGGNPQAMPTMPVSGSDPGMYMNPSNVNPNSLMVFNPQNPKETKYEKLNSRPNWLCFDMSGNKLFVVDFDNRILVYDTSAGNALIASIPLPQAIVTDMVMNPRGGLMYVTLLGPNPRVGIINTSTMALIGFLNLPVLHSGEVGQPLSLAVNRDGSRVYVAMGSTAYGQVAVLDNMGQRVMGTVAVGANPTGICITPDGSMLYIACSNAGNVWAVDTSSLTPQAQIRTGVQPIRIAMHPSGTKAYVTCQGDGTVSVISTAHNRLMATVPVGNVPLAVAVSPDGKYVYVGNQGSGTVSVLDGNSDGVLYTTQPMPNSQPFGVAVKP